jgi:RNA polymerase sigma-70 factor (ECF subfamily)
MIPMSDASVPRPLETYRSYLRVLAGVQFPLQLRSKLDASDLVHITLLKAHERFGQFQGQTSAQLAAWLRRILSNVLTDELRRVTHGDLALQQSIGPAVAHSSARLEEFLAAKGSSPSEQAERQEQLLRLANALAQLSAYQRQAVEMRHLQGLQVAEIAKRMQRSKSAVGGLLRHGMRRLRKLMQEGSNDAP